MDTYITRVWMNNCNNFVISDDPDKHESAVVGMVSRGGTKLESHVCDHELGQVVICTNEKSPSTSDQEQ